MARAWFTSFVAGEERGTFVQAEKSIVDLSSDFGMSWSISKRSRIRTETIPIFRVLGKKLRPVPGKRPATRSQEKEREEEGAGKHQGACCTELSIFTINGNESAQQSPRGQQQ